MRLTFFLLVLANLLFLAWMQAAGDGAAGREPQRLAAQIQPEKIKVTPQPTEPIAPEDCRRLGGLTSAQAEQLQKVVAEAAGGLAATAVAGTAAPYYWVHIPALPSKAAAEKKVSELRLIGVTDFQVIQVEGPMSLAISLGIFPTEDAANEFLQNLIKKGVRSARVEAKSNGVARVDLELRGEAALLARRLPELTALVPATVEACR